MTELDRRNFLKVSGLVGLGTLSAGNTWSLTALEPIGDTLNSEYPYRGWEDIYRGEYAYDSIGYAAHCVNCAGNCAFKIMIKDGIAVREEQLARYPQIADSIPDTNPRGCQKGAVHTQSMYEADRIRYPMKRTGERGEGKWQRISWDKATEEIADKIIDIYETHGPGALLTHSGTGALSHGKISAGLRFASLTGGVLQDGFTEVGDGQAGQYLAYGDTGQNCTTDAWFDADYILLSYLNANVTRIPDAHYLWEAKYNGARVISVSPDYNPSGIHTDLWLNIAPGADPHLYMAMVHTLLEEELWDRVFVKEQTDLPLLVKADGDLLRQADLETDGNPEVFYHWDQATQSAVMARGSMGSEEKTLALGNTDPALKGEFQVGEFVVQPAFERMRAEAMKFSPEATQAITGLHPDVVRGEARAFARANKAIIAGGFASGKMLNGIYTQWAQVLLCALTAHVGDRGGYMSPWTDWGWESVFLLSFVQPGKMPRFEAGGLGEYIHGGKIVETRQFYDDDKLKAVAGFNVDDMQSMIDEVVDKGLMPVHKGVKAAILIADNKFVRNKGPFYRARMLERFKELFVNINIRMDSTAAYADYVLPAAGQYETWDLRVEGLHRFANFFTAPVKPLGESKAEWEIMVLLTRKIQERAKARGIQPYQDGPVERNFLTIHDDYTMNGTLMTAKDELRYLVENNPQFQGQTFEEGVKQGFLTMWNSPSPASAKVRPDRPVMAWKAQVEDKVPYPTLSGRITFYCDHPWYKKLGATVPTARLNAGKHASKYPYTFYTPHTRWGIHTNWRSNKYMLRLQRGEPNVYLNPALAAEKGIADGDPVRVFNNVGEFYAQAKIVPTVRDDQVMMEHAWENHQFRERKGYNQAVATLIQPLELVGDWGHLRFSMFRWNPNQLANESAVDIERARLDGGAA